MVQRGPVIKTVPVHFRTCGGDYRETPFSASHNHAKTNKHRRLTFTRECYNLIERINDFIEEELQQ